MNLSIITVMTEEIGRTNEFVTPTENIEPGCICDCYNCLKWSIIVFLVIQAVVFPIILSIFATQSEVVKERLFGSQPNEGAFVGAVITVAVANAFGIAGALKESFWLILLCLIIEIISFFFTVFSNVSFLFMTHFVLIVLAVIFLILMGIKGKYRELPFRKTEA